MIDIQRKKKKGKKKEKKLAINGQKLQNSTETAGNILNANVSRNPVFGKSHGGEKADC